MIIGSGKHPCHRIVGADSLHRDGDSQVFLAWFATDMATACRMESPAKYIRLNAAFRPSSRTPSPVVVLPAGLFQQLHRTVHVRLNHILLIPPGKPVAFGIGRMRKPV